MTDPWLPRIQRAETLAREDGPAATLIRFYARLLREQQKIHDALQGRPLTWTIDGDMSVLLESGYGLLEMVIESGPQPLVLEAQGLLTSPWRLERTAGTFLPKALLQPYEESRPPDRLPLTDSASTTSGASRCPHCSGAPQLSILDGADAMTAGGGSRTLQCSRCLRSWTFRRLACPACGNDDEGTLGYYQSPTFPHVRVDACQRCGHYLKTIDRGRLGIAVPLVDELAAASLDIWARDQGYEKIELNLVGL